MIGFVHAAPASSKLRVLRKAQVSPLQGDLDHIALACRDVESMVHFYSNIVGFATVDLEEFRAGKRPFPSVRLNPSTIIDFFPAENGEASFSDNVSHFCINLDESLYKDLMKRLADSNIEPDVGERQLSGAKGTGTAIYFRDPQNNRVEFRFY